jgi:HSP20 family molecular chaperone IbpA
MLLYGGYGHEDFRPNSVLAFDHGIRPTVRFAQPVSSPRRGQLPAYNIERTGADRYRIALALAGFTPEQVTITAEQNVLTIEGARPEKSEQDYLYQGIATRPSRRIFNLADHVQ